MRSTMLSAGLALAIAALPPARAQAQDACSEEVKVPPMGGWAEYQGTGKNQDSYTLRFAMVGAEQRQGRTLHRLEIQTEGRQQGQSMIMQVLVPNFPYGTAEVEEVVMKAEGQPAMRMSAKMMEMMRQQMGNDPAGSFREACKTAKLIGEESVTVPAGTFKTRHYRDDRHATDVWVTSGLPFGLVKTTGQGHQMVLRSHGTGAKSSITETPMEMPGM